MRAHPFTGLTVAAKTKLMGMFTRCPFARSRVENLEYKKNAGV